MKTLLAFLVFVFYNLHVVFAQGTNEMHCYTNELMQQKIKENPALLKQLQINEQAITQWIKNHPDYRTRGVITIPVVVHLIYNIDSPDEQLTDQQITSQIDAMNEDYRRENVDSLKTPGAFQPVEADCQIQFCLAKKDPDGNFTTGIVRKQTGFGSFNDFTSVKLSSEGGDDGWPYADYMNVWVCNLSGGVLGYTQLPDMGLNNLDGCVVYYKTFGRINQSLGQYNRGRTLTHEAGHWLDLFHPWGNGGDCATNSDSVGDTPNQLNAVFGCPDFPDIDSCSKKFPGTIFMDYMEYVDDSCMNIFTTGQATRMMGTLNVLRPSILNATTCNAPTIFPLDIGISDISSPAMVIKADSLSPAVSLTNFGTATITSATIYYERNYKSALHQYNWTGSLTGGETVNVALPKMADSSGYQLFIAYTKNPNGQADSDTTNDFKTRSYYVNPTDETNRQTNVSFVIYPNPATGNIILQFSSALNNNVSVYSLVNILGQQENVEWKTISSNQIEMELSGLSPSLYFIRVKTGNNIIDKKLLVVR